MSNTVKTCRFKEKKETNLLFTVYVLIGVLIAQGGNAIRIVFGFLIVVIGIVYAVLEFIPSIEPPENFKAHGHVLEDNDEEDIIWIVTKKKRFTSRAFLIIYMENSLYLLHT